MKIKNIGKVGIASLYSSNPGDAVRGYIDTENSHTSSITVNVLWANGIIEGDNFWDIWLSYCAIYFPSTII